jgi:hypothetical protein
MHRLDIDQLLDILAPIAPGEEAPAGMKIRRAGILVVEVTAKNSRKRRAAPSPPAATIAGTTVPPARRVSTTGRAPDSTVTSSVDSEVSFMRTSVT